MNAGKPNDYLDLTRYTLALGDEEFIHQVVVDTFAVQNATSTSKPISMAFGLVGLYLHHERGCTGRQVQRAHMDLARAKSRLFTPSFPKKRARITVSDVLAVPEGPERRPAIETWSWEVWHSWIGNYTEIADWLSQEQRDLKYHPLWMK